MIFYDSNANPKEILVTEKISHLYNSHYIYKTSDGRCLKVFRIYDIGPDINLERKIQSLQLGNFFTIDEYLFNQSKTYSGFLMPFYQSSSEDILLKPSAYISDNFISIFQSFDRLASNHIETWDANHENTIFTENNIIIIDDERYSENCDDDIQAIRYRNYKNACWILYQSLIKSAANHEEFTDIDFYNWFKNVEPNGIEMCQELSKHKYPIEYLRKVKRKIK